MKGEGGGGSIIGFSILVGPLQPPPDPGALYQLPPPLVGPEYSYFSNNAQNEVRVWDSRILKFLIVPTNAAVGGGAAFCVHVANKHFR